MESIKETMFLNSVVNKKWIWEYLSVLKDQFYNETQSLPA